MCLSNVENVGDAGLIPDDHGEQPRAGHGLAQIQDVVAGLGLLAHEDVMVLVPAASAAAIAVAGLVIAIGAVRGLA